MYVCDGTNFTCTQLVTPRNAFTHCYHSDIVKHHKLNCMSKICPERVRPRRVGPLCLREPFLPSFLPSFFSFRHAAKQGRIREGSIVCMTPSYAERTAQSPSVDKSRSSLYEYSNRVPLGSIKLARAPHMFTYTHKFRPSLTRESCLSVLRHLGYAAACSKDE